MGIAGTSFTSKKAFKKPQDPPKGGAGKVIVDKTNPAPVHDKSYNHNPMHMKKKIVEKMAARSSKSRAYLS